MTTDSIFFYYFLFYINYSPVSFNLEGYDLILGNLVNYNFLFYTEYVYSVIFCYSNNYDLLCPNWNSISSLGPYDTNCDILLSNCFLYECDDLNNYTLLVYSNDLSKMLSSY